VRDRQRRSFPRRKVDEIVRPYSVTFRRRKRGRIIYSEYAIKRDNKIQGCTFKERTLSRSLYLLHLSHVIPGTCRIIINWRILVQKDYIGILDFTVACNNMMNNAE